MFSKLALLSLAISTTAVAQVGVYETHCGEILFNNSLELTGIKARRSSNLNVNQVVAKTGSHRVFFEFNDGSHIYQMSQLAVDAIRFHGQNVDICVSTRTSEVSRWKTPVVASIFDIY